MICSRCDWLSAGEETYDPWSAVALTVRAVVKTETLYNIVGSVWLGAALICMGINVCVRAKWGVACFAGGGDIWYLKMELRGSLRG
jgi:hypothetical protein